MKYVIALALVLTGCGNTGGAPDKPTEQKSKPEKSYVGRFQPFKELAGVALDTMSGKLCKTYDWHKDNKNAGAMGPYDDAPLCKSLSNCD